ncbi:MAG TPA: hypothetical protein VL240_05275 [Candidatus Binatia bacterium]|nr:hypothetical protein [Candidatus Binatia bacterium]
MSAELPTHFPAEVLEQRAAEQRHRIHESVTQLKSCVRQRIRERLDVNSYARQHIWPLLAGVATVGLTTGYVMTGIFTRH